MEPRADSDRNGKSKFPAAFAAGAGVVLILLGVFWLLTRSAQPTRTAVHKLPFGPTEQAYVRQIHFQSGEMSHATNFLNQEFIYIEGKVSNDGARTVGALAVTFEFRDALDQVILRDTDSVIDSSTGNLGPGTQRDFRITFEHVPSSWTQQYPSLQVSGMILE